MRIAKNTTVLVSIDVLHASGMALVYASNSNFLPRVGRVNEINYEVIADGFLASAYKNIGCNPALLPMRRLSSRLVRESSSVQYENDDVGAVGDVTLSRDRSHAAVLGDMGDIEELCVEVLHDVPEKNVKVFLRTAL